MKNISMKKYIILSFLLFFSMPYSVIANDSTSENRNAYLSDRESLIPMFVRGSISNKEFPFRRINPDIRQYVLFYLEKDNLDYFIAANGIRLLGFVGISEDIEFINEYLQSHFKNIENDERFRQQSDNISLSSGAFVGMMIKRNIKGAEKFFQQYGQISAWMPLEGTSPQYKGLAKTCYSSFLIGVYQYSKADFTLPLLKQKSSDRIPFIHEFLVDSLEKQEEDLYTVSMRPSPTPEKELKENISKYLEQNGDWIDMLLKKQTYVEWHKAQDEQKAGSDVEKKPFEIVDMNETIEGKNIKAMTIDSVKAYFKMPTKGNAENVLIKKEFLQELQKKLLKDFDNFHIMAEVEATINNFVPSINISQRNNETTALKPNIVRDKVYANVTFDIKGTSDMLKKYGPDAVHVSLLSPKTGNFIVNMIRINENWIWAPVVNSPVSTDSNIVDDKYLIDSVNKAMVAYSQISQSIIDGNYDPLTIPVLDNDKLIPLEKRKKDKDGMTKALDMEKQILEDLKKNNLNNYGDFRLKITFDAILDNGTLNIDTGSMPKDIKGYETADLTFTVLNGGEAYKAHTSSRNDQSWADPKGNLKVTMKRINGVWYWNPFGW